MKEKLAIAGLVFAILGCIGTYLALPQIQAVIDRFFSDPTATPAPIALASATLSAQVDVNEAAITAVPTNTATETSNPTATLTDTPSPPTATSTSTPTNTPRPTKTNTATPLPPSPTPTVAGIGSWVGDESFQVKLLDYDFRSASNEVDDSAVRVFLSYINNTDSEVEIAINWYIVEGIDNIGTKYGEINSVGDRYFSYSNAQEQLENWSMVVPPNSIETMWMDLHIEGNNSGHITRVDIRTDWIDLKIPSIIYRTDKLNQVSANWRLTRN